MERNDGLWLESGVREEYKAIIGIYTPYLDLIVEWGCCKEKEGLVD